MEMVFKFGLIVQNMKANGETAKPKVEVCSIMLMETFTLVSSGMTAQMAMECTYMKTDKDMKDIG